MEREKEFNLGFDTTLYEYNNEMTIFNHDEIDNIMLGSHFVDSSNLFAVDEAKEKAFKEQLAKINKTKVETAVINEVNEQPQTLLIDDIDNIFDEYETPVVYEEVVERMQPIGCIPTKEQQTLGDEEITIKAGTK